MKKVFSLILSLTIIFSITSCNDGPNSTKLSKNFYSLYHDESQKIEGTNVSDLVWNSENEFVAKAKDGVITGVLVGKTTIKSIKNLSFTVEVKPKYLTYEEPSLEWGASKETIKARYGVPDEESDTYLGYKTYNTNAPMMTFMFIDNQMTGSGVICNYLAALEIVDFLGERYVPYKLDKKSGNAIFLHCYGKMSEPKYDYAVVMEYKSTDYILVIYVPNKNSKYRSCEDIDFDTPLKQFDEILNKKK